MKKKLIPLIATTLAVSITLSGCSCTAPATLKFSDSFNGDKDVSVPYTETLSYKVELINGYNGEFTKNSLITNDVLEYDYNGEYVVTLSVLDKTDAKLKDLKSDVLTDSSISTSKIYHVKSQLNLTSNYKAPYGIYLESSDSVLNEVSFNEYITSECFFLPSGYSFNPIYSKTQGNTSFVQISGESRATVVTMEYETEVLYNKTNYSLKEKYGDTTESSSHNYTFRTLIDNNTLLFALRNIGLNSEESYSLSVVHPTYDQAENLTVSFENELSKKVKLNGSQEEISIPVKELSFIRNKENATGSSQYVLIQKDKVSDIENKAMMIQYVSPLSCYGSYISLGALQYTLTSYSYSN